MSNNPFSSKYKLLASINRIRDILYMLQENERNSSYSQQHHFMATFGSKFLRPLMAVLSPLLSHEMALGSHANIHCILFIVYHCIPLYTGNQEHGRQNSWKQGISNINPRTAGNQDLGPRNSQEEGKNEQ